jgi:hypothetical protein
MNSCGCKALVWGEQRFRSCSRQAWKDGWCKQHHPDTVAKRRSITECQRQLKEAQAQFERLKKSLIHTAAHLAAAISLLERGGKAAKKAAPSDKMFDQMLLDYKKALSDARAALTTETKP